MTSPIVIYELNTASEAKHFDNPIYVEYKCSSVWSGLQEIAKNKPESPIIGILSNSFYFVEKDIPLFEQDINKILSSYDIILPFEGKIAEKTLHEHFNALGYDSNTIAMCREAIMSCADEYQTSFDYVANNSTMFMTNQFIMKADLFTEYVDFLTTVKACLDTKADISAATWDLLIGWLLKVFITNHPIAVKNCFCEKEKLESWDASVQKRDLTSVYIDMRLKELIDLRKATGFGSDSLIDDVICADDFDSKIPIWICWWQGEADMPPLIRACVESIKRNIPTDMTLRLITLDNCLDYVTFTPTIINKFDAGHISYTHMSDLLRSELLYRYGGMWIDVTYYVSNKIPIEEISAYDWYTLVFNEPLWNLDLIQGRWASSLMYSKPKHPIMQFLTEALWIYWETETSPIDYFFFDYILDSGYRHFEIIRDILSNLPKTNYYVFSLQMRLNQRFSPLENKHLYSDSVFYKINRRNEYFATTPTGYQTVYGHILDKAGLLPSESSETDTDNNVTPDNHSETYSITPQSFDAYISDKSKGISALFEDIRRANPAKIIDDGMNLVRYGFSSRYILPQILFEEVELIGINSLNMPILPIYNRIYNEIL